MGPGAHRLIKRSGKDEGEMRWVPPRAPSGKCACPGTAIAFDSDKRLDRSSLGFWPPHQSMQSNPRQHVDYRTDRSLDPW